MSFLMVLFLIFMVLKLVGVITWSWWLVCLGGKGWVFNKILEDDFELITESNNG